MENSTKQAFSDRLREEMIAQGYGAPRSELGADPEALRLAAQVNSVTSARKWLSGDAIPRTDLMQRIADWLGVRTAWLRDGEEPKYPGGISRVSEVSAPYGNLPPHQRQLIENMAQLSAIEQRAVMDLVNAMAQSKLVEVVPAKKDKKSAKSITG